MIFVKSSIHFREIIRSPDDIKQLIEERDNIPQTNPADPKLTLLQTGIKHKRDAWRKEVADAQDSNRMWTTV